MKKFVPNGYAPLIDALDTVGRGMFPKTWDSDKDAVIIPSPEQRREENERMAPAVAQAEKTRNVGGKFSGRSKNQKTIKYSKSDWWNCHQSTNQYQDFYESGQRHQAAMDELRQALYSGLLQAWEIADDGQLRNIAQYYWNTDEGGDRLH